MAATFNFVPPAGYTFGVLAFLRSLRVWGPGPGEEREGVGSGWPQLLILFPRRGILSFVVVGGGGGGGSVASTFFITR